MYKRLVRQRLAVLNKEVAQKNLVKELVAKARLKRLPDGRIKFKYDGVTICITPQDEKVSVQEDEDD